VLAEVTAREIGRVTIAEALELTAPVARKQPHRYGGFAARWLCLYLEEHEKATLDDVELLSRTCDLSPPEKTTPRRSQFLGRPHGGAAIRERLARERVGTGDER
jgi:hypothetical protein